MNKPDFHQNIPDFLMNIPNLDYYFGDNKPKLISELQDLLLNIIQYNLDYTKASDYADLIPATIPWNTLLAFNKQMMSKHISCKFTGIHQTVDIQTPIAKRIISSYANYRPDLFKTYSDTLIIETQPYALSVAESIAYLLFKNIFTLPQWNNFLEKFHGKNSRNQRRDAVINHLPQFCEMLMNKIKDPNSTDDKALVFNLLACTYTLRNIIESLSVCNIDWKQLRGFNYNGNSYIPTTLYIPEGVRSIAAEAFWYRCYDDKHPHWNSLTTVIFPSSLREIGYNAFRGFNSLEKLDFSKVQSSEQQPLKIHAGAFSANRQCAGYNTVMVFNSIKEPPNFTIKFYLGDENDHKPFEGTNIILPSNMRDTLEHSLPIRRL